MKKSFKFILPGIALTFCNIGLASDDKNPEAQIAETLTKMMEYDKNIPNRDEVMELNKKWNLEFTDYLTTHNNPDINVFGFLKKSLELPKNSNPGEYQEIADELNHLVKDKRLSTQSLYISSSICSQPEIIDFCDVQVIHKKLIQSAPENITVYLPILNQYIEENDTDKIKTTMRRLSITTNADSFSYIPEDLEILINEYSLNHPFPDALIENEINALKSLSAATPELIEEISNDFNSYQSFNSKLLFKLKLPIPVMKPLVDICKTDSSLSHDCIKIADIMVADNHSIIMTMVGHSIKVEALRLNGKYTDAENAEFAKSTYKKQYECLMRIKSSASDQLDIYLTPEDFAIYAEIERTQGELATFRKMAEMSFQKQLSSGNEDAINPESCFNK